MKFRVLCSEEPIGEVELDSTKAQQWAPLAAFDAFERIRSALEREADARYAVLERIADAMPEALFATLSSQLGGEGVSVHQLSPDEVEADHPEFASVLRDQSLAVAAPTSSSLQLRLVGEQGDARLASARVRLWMPPYQLRRSGVLPQIIALLTT